MDVVYYKIAYTVIPGTIYGVVYSLRIFDIFSHYASSSCIFFQRLFAMNNHMAGYNTYQVQEGSENQEPKG